MATSCFKTAGSYTEPEPTLCFMALLIRKLLPLAFRHVNNGTLLVFFPEIVASPDKTASAWFGMGAAETAFGRKNVVRIPQTCSVSVLSPSSRHYSQLYPCACEPAVMKS